MLGLVLFRVLFMFFSFGLRFLPTCHCAPTSSLTCDKRHVPCAPSAIAESAALLQGSVGERSPPPPGEGAERPYARRLRRSLHGYKGRREEGAYVSLSPVPLRAPCNFPTDTDAFCGIFHSRQIDVITLRRGTYNASHYIPSPPRGSKSSSAIHMHPVSRQMFVL